MIYDVIVIGAGVGGVAVAYECGKAGISCIVLDENKEPSFASVKNQGWLHSGALFALHEAQDVASTCALAFEEICALARQFDPDMLSEKPGVAFLSSENRARQLMERARACGISTRALARTELSDVGAALLSGPFHRCAVEIPDRSINNFSLMTLISSLAHQSGARFHVGGWAALVI